MTQKQSVTATPVVYLDAKKNLDKDIDLARFGARKDRVTVVIQRTITTKRGDLRRIPLLEITPTGDVLEIPAPRLRTPISAHVTEADLLYRTGLMNVREGKGHAHFASLARVSRDYMAAKAEHEASHKSRRRDRQRPTDKRAA